MTITNVAVAIPTIWGITLSNPAPKLISLCIASIAQPVGRNAAHGRQITELFL